MTIRIPLAKGHCATVLSVYAPTLSCDNKVKKEFYEALQSTLTRVPHTDKITLLGDLNARVSSIQTIWAMF